MRKSEAKKIVNRGVTWSQIHAMLKRAYDAGAANSDRATVNKSFTKATSFNILSAGVADFNPDTIARGLGETMAAINCLREFGKYWRGWRPEKKKRVLPDPIHQEAEIPF